MKRPASHGRGILRGTLSVEEYAQLTGKTPAQVRKRMATGRLPFIEINGELRVDCPVEAQPTSNVRPS